MSEEQWTDLVDRADDMSRSDIMDRTVLTHRERQTLRKLTGPGQRLLIGPRGSGKSTYLKFAYFSSLEDGSVMPVYANYRLSISLEPSFRRDAKASSMFRQWILANLMNGVRQTLSDMPDPTLSDDEATLLQGASGFVECVEKGTLKSLPNTDFSVSAVVEFIENLATRMGYSTAVLLLDDAAHAFSSEQQQEFFEVFASLKSKTVSAKAAVYPGVTSYTPRFHIGHDAQLIQVWLDPADPGYLNMMMQVAEKRTSAKQFEYLKRREGVIEYLALASFGIPRTFIRMVSEYLERAESLEGPNPTPSKVVADKSVESAVATARQLFETLQKKLPRYRHFIDVGAELLTKTTDALDSYNTKRNGKAKAMTVLYERPIPPEANRMIGFLEYAGLVRRTHSVNMGETSYEVVVINYGVLLQETALGLGRNPAITAAVDALERRPPNVWARRKIDSLLGRGFQARCRLDLAACPQCGTPREVAEAKFCFNCGARLEEASLYDELLAAPVSSLPLTDAMLKRLTEDDEFSSVKDLILDEERQKLLRVRYVGPVRAARILTLAEEFVYE